MRSLLFCFSLSVTLSVNHAFRPTSVHRQSLSLSSPPPFTSYGRRSSPSEHEHDSHTCSRSSSTAAAALFMAANNSPSQPPQQQTSSSQLHSTPSVEDFATSTTDLTSLSTKSSTPTSLITVSSDSESDVTVTSNSYNSNFKQYRSKTKTELRRQQLLESRARKLRETAWTNGIIIGSCSAVALYQLFHVDVEAILALYEYGLGHVSAAQAEEITRLAVTVDLVTRWPIDALQSYEALVPQNPVFYKACTSGVAYALGDFVAQLTQGRDLVTIDLPRSLRSGVAGFIGHGPLCHYWLQFMETYLDFDGAWWATGIKVTADLTVWSIFLNAAYSTIIGLLQFRHPKDVWADVSVTLWPALTSAWRFWPFVHTVSFSHAVPLDLKLLWVDAMEVVWVTILSKVTNEDKLKAQQEKQDEAVALASGEIPAAYLNESGEIIADPNSSSSNGNTDPMVAKAQEIFGACWPLLAMWPVLYAGYRVEILLGLVTPHA